MTRYPQAKGWDKLLVPAPRKRPRTRKVVTRWQQYDLNDTITDTRYRGLEHTSMRIGWDY